MKTKQQQWSDFALEQITVIMKKNEKKLVPEKLVNKIVGMPNMILSNGLLQTLAFLLSKKDNEGKKISEEVEIFNIFKEFFNRKDICSDFSIIDTLDDMKLLGSFCKDEEKMTPKKYLNIQNECLRMLEYLKRYARAFGE